MLNNLAKKIFGTPNDRYLKKINLILDEVYKLESNISKFSDQELKDTTEILKKLYADNKD